MDEIFEDRMNFNKVFYLTVGSLMKNTLKFLPSQKSNLPQQVFLGDCRGILYVAEYKKGEPDIKIRTSPFQREISCVDLNYTVKSEKIYFSFGNSILITNRQCKEYSKIEFDLADNINMFKVIDNNVWAVSNNYISRYEFGDSTLEKGTFDNEYPIQSLHVTEVYGKSKPLSIIGSDDSKIKVVATKELIHSIPVNSTPTCIFPMKQSSYDYSENNYLFGTRGGSHGILNIEKDSSKILWENNINSNYSDVVCLRSVDINLDGQNEIILARSNGEVNIFSIGQTILETSLISKFDTKEVLTGFDVGKFKTDDDLEIMFSSYSGLVFSLMPKVNIKEKNKKPLDKKTFMKNFTDLSNEVETLKGLIVKKNEEYEKQTNQTYNALNKNPFKLNYKFILLSEEANFLFTVDSEFPIEMIILQSTVNIDLQEVLTKDVGINVLSDEKNKFIATFKFKESIHQVEMKLRTYEGMSDNLNCTVIPYNKPKTAYVLEIPIKSLSLHRKIEENNESIKIKHGEENSLNILNIKGKFSSSEINQILSMILPDIPEKLNKDSAVYFMESTFLHTIIEINFENNFCQIKSNYLTPLIIIKEQVTKEANFTKKEMEFNIQIKTISIFKILDIIDPKIKSNFELETQFKIIQGLKEIDLKKYDLGLPNEYSDLLNKSEELTKYYNLRSINTKYLKSIIENLMRNISKVRTISNLAMKLKELDDIFEDYTYEKIIDLFKELKNV